MQYRNLFKTVMLALLAFTACQKPIEKVEWPQITTENKPMTRWWWLGNILEKKDLSEAIKTYADAGIGGLEITPIYGVKGQEDRFIDYLTDEWTDKLVFTLNEAQKHDMVVDMATGTGWPFGGPWVTPDDACKYMTYKTYSLKAGQKLEEKVEMVQKPMLRTIGRRVSFDEIVDPIVANKDLQQIAFEQVRYEKPMPLVTLMAYGNNNEKIELTDKVSNGNLDWTAPEGKWKLYAVFQGWHGKMVERAAPGGEGDVIDHFNKSALNNYFKKFDQAFEGKDISYLRAFFNDSYEVDDARGEADFTPQLFTAFEAKRGYNLKDYLPALYGNDTANNIDEKVLMDYRQTISELLLENFTQPWGEWAQNKGAVIRNQAHGSPANILDLYAAVDIPETEGKDLIKIKFASSASHVTGKQLTSCEAATWLDEHFQGTLEETKESIDRYFLGGVNHIFYHGTPFSPKDEAWPGIMFYASVHYAPTNTFWNDFKAFNQYVARCQSFLQAGKPANNVLVYFPFNDRISDRGRSLLQHFSGGGPQGGTAFRKLVDQLINEGYAIDFISDKQLQQCSVSNKQILSGQNKYDAVVIPQCEYMPFESLEILSKMKDEGIDVVFNKTLPQDIPGLDVNDKLSTFQQKLDNLQPDTDLSAIAYLKEPMVKMGLQYIKRKNDNGYTYFIKNTSENAIDSYIPLNEQAENIVIFDTQTGDFGKAATKEIENENQVYLQMLSEQTLILRLYNNTVEAASFNYIEKAPDAMVVEGTWNIDFVQGGPVLPQPQNVTELFSWTAFKGTDYANFSGSAKYSIDYAMPYTEVDAWLLDLGDVHESAKILINGEELATLYNFPYQVLIPFDKMHDEVNIEIVVSNLMANRISYMDKNNLEYKRFYNVNFAARKGQNRGEDGLFTAKNWEPMSSGLIGPVTLTGVHFVQK